MSTCFISTCASAPVLCATGRHTVSEPSHSPAPGISSREREMFELDFLDERMCVCPVSLCCYEFESRCIH